MRPGHELIREAGGLYLRFMNWKKPILTDSGGFQVFSLGDLRKPLQRKGGVPVAPRRVAAYVHPLKAVEVREALGSDIMMVLDDVHALIRRTLIIRSIPWSRDTPVGKAVQGGADVGRPGVVWHCAGRDVSEPAQAERGVRLPGSTLSAMRSAAFRRGTKAGDV